MALVMTMLSRKHGFLSSLATLNTFEFLLDSLVFHLHSDVCALPLDVNWISEALVSGFVQYFCLVWILGAKQVCCWRSGHFCATAESRGKYSHPTPLPPSKERKSRLLSLPFESIVRKSNQRFQEQQKSYFLYEPQMAAAGIDHFSLIQEGRLLRKSSGESCCKVVGNSPVSVYCSL